MMYHVGTWGTGPLRTQVSFSCTLLFHTADLGGLAVVVHEGTDPTQVRRRRRGRRTLYQSDIYHYFLLPAVSIAPDGRRSIVWIAGRHSFPWD